MKPKQATSAVLAEEEPTDPEKHIAAAAPLSDSMQEAVDEELRRLITSSRFRSSHRCQAFLRYVVENKLKGTTGSLKERSIGTRVFGRDLNYDTNSDPVVRMAAAEVRKKLAQYYYDPANKSQIQIELPAGCYEPVFSSSGLFLHTSKEGVSPISEIADVKSEEQAGAPAQIVMGARWSRHAIWWLVAMFIVVVASVVLLEQFQPKPPDDFERFWAPVVTSPNTVLLCVGHRMLTAPQYNSYQALGPSATPNKPAKNDDQTKYPDLGLHDAITLADIAGVLGAHKKAFSVRGQAFTIFEDLQKGPVVLLGSFNNHWTIRLMESMRFHFVTDPNGFMQWIADEQKPGARIGEVQAGAYFTAEDYALVARVFVPQSKYPTIIAAGLDAASTHAAGDFITNPVYIDDFFKNAPQNWQTKNMELLIVTKDVNGDSGPPKVLASYFW